MAKAKKKKDARRRMNVCLNSEEKRMAQFIADDMGTRGIGPAIRQLIYQRFRSLQRRNREQQGN